jgi:hypothetical protein
MDTFLNRVRGRLRTLKDTMSFAKTYESDIIPHENALHGETDMVKKKPETSLRGRDAKTGLFIPVKKARQRPSTTTVERVPLPGKGRK